MNVEYLTIGMTDVFGCFEGSGDNNTSNQEDVVDLRNVDLTFILDRGINHLHSWEASQT